MNNRLLALTGPLFFVLFAVLLFFVDDDGPGEKASGKAVVDFVNDHDDQLFVGAFGGPLVAALIVIFFSYVASVARGRGALGAGPSVMVAGAVVWAGGMLLGSMLELAVVSAADNGLEQVAQTLNVLLEAEWLPFIAGAAITLIGAGMTSLRSGIVPSWLGWVALVVGIVGLAGPGGFLTFFVGPIWMLVGGILLYLRAEQEPATA
jgi:hypothetical protein